jgi:hypothetical protein
MSCLLAVLRNKLEEEMCQIVSVRGWHRVATQTAGRCGWCDQQRMLAASVRVEHDCAAYRREPEQELSVCAACQADVEATLHARHWSPVRYQHS